MARIFITGGRGMVGQNLREHAAAGDHEILAPGRAALDLSDAAAVADFYATERPDLVIHGAGRVGGIQANIAHPVAFLTENVTIGQNVILGAHRAGVGALINLGSTCIYPREGQNPLREEAILTGPLEPTNEGYALAKIMALRLCDYIRHEDPSRAYKTLIPCNLYGRHDTFDPAASHLVPAILRKVHEARETGTESVEIWGDGTARREFMYAGDLADAVWRAAGDMLGEGSDTAETPPESMPDLMNVGIGHDHSVNDYYAAAAAVVGWEGHFTHDLSRPVGMKQKLASSERLHAWGWQAPTTLEDGLRRTYDFFLQTET